MVLIRAILSVLIMFSLAVTPVGMAYASPAKAAAMATMKHCDKKDMANCPCCHKAVPCQFDSSCAVKCVKILSALTCPAMPTAFSSTGYPVPADDTLNTRSWPPPAPPPRT